LCEVLLGGGLFDLSLVLGSIGAGFGVRQLAGFEASLSLGLLSGVGGGGFHAASESLNLACRVNDTLLARVERVANATQVSP
jgi:hypothetical protein